MSNLLAFIRDKSGATAIAYGLLIAGIALAVVAVVIGLGTDLNASFASVSVYFK